jgi:hypothetical protein
MSGSELTLNLGPKARGLATSQPAKPKFAIARFFFLPLFVNVLASNNASRHQNVQLGSAFGSCTVLLGMTTSTGTLTPTVKRG